MAVELLGQLIVQFLFSLSPFFSFPPLLGDQTETRMILILRKWRDRPRRGEMAAVED